MNAAKRKLRSSSGATILMALLFFLVAAMVSAVIISAAISATRSLKTRRDNQQAYLTCSSATEYIRDLLLSKDGYKIVFLQNYIKVEDRVNYDLERIDRNDTAARDDKDIAKIVDSLFSQVMSGPHSNILFSDIEPNPVECKVQMEDLDPVAVELKLKCVNKDSRRYCLTAKCELTGDVPVQMILRMFCSIQLTTVDMDGTVGTGYNRRATYQVVWEKDNATILREGMEVTQ